MKKLIVVAYLILSVVVSHAATFYIDPTCATPGDGTGSVCAAGATDPFDQWSDVTWTAGNTYLQKGGTTALAPSANPKGRFVVVGATGTAGNIITIGSYGTGKAIIDGSYAMATGSWTANDPVSGVYSYATAWGTSLLWEDQVPLLPATTSSCLDGNNWYSAADKIYYRPTSGAIGDHLVESYQMVGVDTANYGYITIENIEFKKLFYGVVNKITPQTDANNIIIQNCSFSNIPRGIMFVITTSNSSNITIDSNTFDYVAASAIVATLESGSYNNVVMSNNTITHCSEAYGAVGYDWADALTGTAQDTEGLSWQDASNSYAYGNNITGSCRGFYSYANGTDSTHDVHIYRNYIATGRAGMLFAPSNLAASFYNHYVYGNVFYDCGVLEAASNNSAVFIRPPNSPTEAWNYFFNNTIVSSGTLDIHGMFILPFEAYSDMYWEIKNNLFYGSTAASKHIWEYYTPANIVYDRNMYYPDKANAFYRGANKTFAQWQAIDTSHDANSSVADPLVVSASDFHLQGASPAKAAGLNLGTGFTDFAGVSLPTPYGWPIGGYGYGNTNTGEGFGRATGSFSGNIQ